MKGADNRRAAEAVGGKNHQAAPDRHRDQDTELAAWARERVATWPPLTTAQRDLVSRGLGAAAAR